jgi:4'-phosphopantetheinyl transferase
VGIDVECVRAHRDYGEIARWFFSPSEVDHLASVPMHLYAESFIRCWTRKEAYLKARGDGFSVPVDEGHVPAPGSSDVVQADGWSFHTLRPAPGYIGALAIGGSGWRVSRWQWEMRPD